MERPPDGGTGGSSTSTTGATTSTMASSSSGMTSPCDGGATCSASEVCAYDPLLGCGSSRVCVDRERYPTCNSAVTLCSCPEGGDASKHIAVDCNSYTTQVPSGYSGPCGID